MRLIDADQFGVISLQGKSEDFIEGVEYILNLIDNAPTIETSCILDEEESNALMDIILREGEQK